MNVKELIDRLTNYCDKFGEDIPVYVKEWDDDEFVSSIDHLSLHIPVLGGEMYISLVESNEG